MGYNSRISRAFQIIPGRKQRPLQSWGTIIKNISEGVSFGFCVKIQIELANSIGTFKPGGIAVAAEKPADVSVLELLQALGVSLVTEWDTLVFLYNHSACLGTAAQIARLMGYERAEIAAALHQLEEVGLIQRSRNAQGRRIYKFSDPPEPGRHSRLLDLMSLAQNRTGRLLLLKHLKRPCQERRVSREGGLRLA